MLNYVMCLPPAPAPAVAVTTVPPAAVTTVPPAQVGESDEAGLSSPKAAKTGGSSQHESGGGSGDGEGGGGGGGGGDEPADKWLHLVGRCGLNNPV